MHRFHGTYTPRLKDKCTVVYKRCTGPFEWYFSNQRELDFLLRVIFTREQISGMLRSKDKENPGILEKSRSAASLHLRSQPPRFHLTHLSFINHIWDRDIVDCIKAIDLPSNNQFVWKFSSTGPFSIRSRHSLFSPQIRLLTHTKPSKRWKGLPVGRLWNQKKGSLTGTPT